MRRWGLSAVLAAAPAAILAVALAAPVPALAQAEQAPPGKVMVKRAKGSPLAQVLFPEPARMLDDDGSFAETMQRVGQELSRRCGTVESFVWDFRGRPAEEQQRGAVTVYEATMREMEKAGYKLAEKTVRSIPDPETLVYTADRKDKHLLMLWSPLPDAAFLLICDAAEAAKAEPKTDKKKK